MLPTLTRKRGFLPLSLALLAVGAGLLAFGAVMVVSGSDKSVRLPPVTISPIAATAPSTPKPAIVNDSPISRLVIHSIGIDAPVQVFGLDGNNFPVVPDSSNSRNPGNIVAWYDFSTLPGQGSNAVFAGHVTWEGVAIFYNLQNVQAGDKVSVFTQDGKELVYEVFYLDLVEPSRVDLMDATDEDMVTLITCGGTWVPDSSDPYGGSYVNRVVVRARLAGLGPL